MFKGFPKPKSKMSQGEEGGGNEVHLGLPCGRQKDVDKLSAHTWHWLPWNSDSLSLAPQGTPQFQHWNIQLEKNLKLDFNLFKSKHQIIELIAWMFSKNPLDYCFVKTSETIGQAALENRWSGRIDMAMVGTSTLIWYNKNALSSLKFQDSWKCLKTRTKN